MQTVYSSLLDDITNVIMRYVQCVTITTKARDNFEGAVVAIKPCTWCEQS